MVARQDGRSTHVDRPMERQPWCVSLECFVYGFGLQHAVPMRSIESHYIIQIKMISPRIERLLTNARARRRITVISQQFAVSPPPAPH